MMRSVGGLKELREGPVWELARMRGAQPATAKNWILPALQALEVDQQWHPRKGKGKTKTQLLQLAFQQMLGLSLLLI